MAAEAGGRHERVVEVDVGPLIRRRLVRERAVAVEGIRPASRVEVPRSLDGARGRPGVDVTPALPENEDATLMCEDALRLTLQNLVEEPQVPLVDLVRARVPLARRSDCPPRRVLPGAEEKLLRRSVNAAERGDDARVEDVVPAAGVEARHADPREVLVNRGGTPVVVIGWVVEPVTEVRGIGVEERQEVADRQLPIEPGQAPERIEERCVSLVVAGPAGRVQSEEGRPAGHRRDRERSAAVRPAVVEARRGEAGCDGGEVWRAGGRREQLGRAGIGEPVHAHLAVRAGEAGSPRDRLEPVGGLIDERCENTVGGIAAAYVLDRHDVTPLRVPSGMGVSPVRAAGGLSVGEPHQEHGQGCFGRRAVDVCSQHDSIR